MYPILHAIAIVLSIGYANFKFMLNQICPYQTFSMCITQFSEKSFHQSVKSQV